MKKIYITLFLTLLFTSAYSQIRFGVKGGVNLSGVSTNDSFLDKNVTGFNIGPSVEWLINGTFGLEGSVLYSEKGLKFENNHEVSTNKTGYVEVPLNLKYRFNLTETVRPFLTAGPYINFKVKGDDNFETITSGIKDQWKTKSFGAGLGFGAGVELFKFVQIGASYGFSLTDNYKVSDGDYSVKDRTWSVTAGVFF